MLIPLSGLGNSTYDAQVAAMADQYGVPPELALAVMRKESSGNPNAVSSAGAIGLFQLMPGTAQELGVNPYDPTQNIQGGLVYLSRMYKQFGNWQDALIAYNEGPGRLSAGTIYPESAAYASSILAASGISLDYPYSYDSSPSDTSGSGGDDTFLGGLSQGQVLALAGGIIGVALIATR